MNQQELLAFLKRAKVKMEQDYKDGNEGKYPPLYSRDYLFGKLKAVKETIQIIER